MLNDTTIVTFEFRPDQPQAVSMAAVAKLAEQMERLAREVLGSLRIPGQAHLNIVASPRSGSIQIIFSPEFSNIANIGTLVIQNLPAHLTDTANKAAGLGWAWFIWHAIFGKHCLIDLFRTRARQAPPVGTFSVENPKELELRLIIAINAVNTRNVQSAVAALMTAAAATHANRVTIQVQDDEPVVVSDLSERMSSGLLAHVGLRIDFPAPQQIIRVSREVLNAKFKGKNVKLFLGWSVVPPSDQNIVVVWGSTLVDVPPENHQIRKGSFDGAPVIVGRPENVRDLSQIELLDPLPDSFLRPAAVVYVPEAAKFG